MEISALRERGAYLEAVETRCPEYKEPDAYVAAMRRLADRWPDDLDALTLYAESQMIPVRWHWYTSGGVAAKGYRTERALKTVRCGGGRIYPGRIICISTRWSLRQRRNGGFRARSV